MVVYRVAHVIYEDIGAEDLNVWADSTEVTIEVESDTDEAIIEALKAEGFLCQDDSVESIEVNRWGGDEDGSLDVCRDDESLLRLWIEGNEFL